MTSPNKRGIFETYQDHLTYPIVVRFNTHTLGIFEMSGKELNDWKKRQEQDNGNTRSVGYTQRNIY